MVPAMFSFEFWKRVAKNREVERWLLSWRLQVNYLMRESGGMTVSVEDAGSVYSSWGFGLLVALV